MTLCDYEGLMIQDVLQFLINKAQFHPNMSFLVTNWNENVFWLRSDYSTLLWGWEWLLGLFRMSSWYFGNVLDERFFIHIFLVDVMTPPLPGTWNQPLKKQGKIQSKQIQVWKTDFLWIVSNVHTLKLLNVPNFVQNLMGNKYLRFRRPVELNLGICNLTKTHIRWFGSTGRQYEVYFAMAITRTKFSTFNDLSV